MAQNNPTLPANAAAGGENAWHSGGQHQKNQKQDNSRLRLALFIGIVLILGLFAFGIIPRMRQNRALAEESKKEKNALPQTVVVKPHPSPDADLTLPGTTQAIQDAVISARTTGYIRKRYVDIGDHVKAGQILADIDAPDVAAQLQQAQQQTGQAVSQVRQAQSDVANRQAGVAQSQSGVRQAEANLEQSRAQLADSRAKLSQSEAQLATAQAQLSQQQQNVDIKRAAVTQAKTQLDLAAVTLRRYETLLKSGYVALQDVDQSQANYDNARSAVNSAEADLRGAEANVKAFRDQVQSARANVSSFQAQVLASQKNVKAVAATVNSAQSAVKAAQANVRSAQSVVESNQANVRAAQANAQRFGVQNQFAQVVAPFDGVITARNVDVGTLINAGGGAGGSGTSGTTSSGASAGSASTGSSSASTTPGGGLFGIARIDTLRVLVTVPQTYAPLMRPGVPANLFIREYPGRTFNGVVTNVSGAIDAVSRTLLTEVHLPNSDGTLLPGMYAQVHFDLPKTRASLRIPSSALMYDAQGTRVAVVTPENKIHLVPIRVGRDFGTEIEVTDGLTGQENVVNSPTDDLAEGMRVDPKQPPPPPPGQPGAAPGGPPPAAPNGQPGNGSGKQPAPPSGGQGR